MSNIMGQVVNNYNEMLKLNKEINVDSWPMMASPGPTLCIVGTYLAFVLKIGPKMMEKRPAFQLNNLLIAYNAFAVLLSILLTVLPLLNIGLMPLVFPHKCSAVHRGITNTVNQEALSANAWWYFITKQIELLDTVFFVLRKKQNQITFLHVYHHTVTSLFSWFFVKSLGGEHIIMLQFLNSFVHIIMYFYYLIAALGPKYKKYLWWKQYMTTIQLTQFGIMLCYLLMTLVMDCKVSKSVIYFFISNAIIFIYLFSDFYRKTYTKKEV